MARCLTSRPQHKRPAPSASSLLPFSALPCRASSKAEAHAAEAPKAAVAHHGVLSLLARAEAQNGIEHTIPVLCKLGLREGWKMAAHAMHCRVNGGGEGGGGMKTVECLRGRLLAERVASKAAKEQADQLSKRLDELEEKLADEVKVRNKAERRLRKAIKKLESLEILDVELSDGSIGSLSSNGRSGHQAPEVEERNNLGSSSSTDSARSGPPGDGASSAGFCTLVNSSFRDGSSCSGVSERSPAGPCMDLGDTNNNCSSGASAEDHGSDRQQHAAPHCRAKSEQDSRDGDGDRLALVLVAGDDSRTEGNTAQTAEHHAGAHEEEAQEEQNKLALVLVDPQPQPAAAPKPHSDVESVLLALQRVKEQLRYTIERRSELVAPREVYGH